MKVLVTGASGFLGSHIAEQLAAQGHQVRALLRRTSSRAFLQGFPHEEAIGDVTDAASLPAAVEGVDAIVHAAGLVKARREAEFHRVNATGTANLLEAIATSRHSVKRFVYVSSLAAHGPSPDAKPRPINAPPQPVSAYGRSKLRGEDAVRSSPIAPRAVIIRPPAVYGPRDPAFLPLFRLVSRRIAPLLRPANQTSIVYGEDAARAIALAATVEADTGGNTYTLDDGNVYSTLEIIASIEDACGRRALRLNSPRSAAMLLAGAQELFGLLARRPVFLTRDKVNEICQPGWACSSEAIHRDLGWSPRTPLTEGMRRTYAWYRLHHWL